MITKSLYPPGTKFVPITYSFLKPARLRIRDVNGIETLVGYGIGEQISVLEPNITLLVSTGEVLDEVPLANGSFVTEWPSDLSMSRV